MIQPGAVRWIGRVGLASTSSVMSGGAEARLAEHKGDQVGWKHTTKTNKESSPTAPPAMLATSGQELSNKYVEQLLSSRLVSVRLGSSRFDFEDLSQPVQAQAQFTTHVENARHKRLRDKPPAREVYDRGRQGLDAELGVESLAEEVERHNARQVLYHKRMIRYGMHHDE